MKFPRLTPCLGELLQLACRMNTERTRPQLDSQIVKIVNSLAFVSRINSQELVKFHGSSVNIKIKQVIELKLCDRPILLFLFSFLICIYNAYFVILFVGTSC